LLAVVVLSYSRSALLAGVIGLTCWFALVPLRLRAALVLALGAGGAALISAWALATHPITHDLASLQSRTNAGYGFGLLLAVVVSCLTVVGFLAAFAMDRITLSGALRRRIGTALIILVALVPVGGVVALGASSRGLTGEVSHLWTTLVDPHQAVGNSATRLVQLGNSRARYWREGFTVADHALLRGVGALGFATARTRYTSDPLVIQHAHSYVVETFADFGLIGLAASLALLIAWFGAAARTVGINPLPRRRARGQSGALASAAPVVDAAERAGPSAAPAVGATERACPSAAPVVDAAEHAGPSAAAAVDAAERAGLLTLLATVVVFGIHSTIDWTWFVPGTALPALLCAGWLGGRGPLAAPIGRLAQRRRLTRAPGAGAAAIGITTIALFAGWAIWQPLRSADADAAATSALSQGNARSALADASAAAAADPASAEPLWELAAIYSATGDQTKAHSELVRAVRLQPENSATWLALGEFNLRQHKPRVALPDLQQALKLNLHSREAINAIAQARAAIAGRAGSTAHAGRAARAGLSARAAIAAHAGRAARVR
jgi:cytochrome c-type biogenesis protein CcmH/NrfG